MKALRLLILLASILGLAAALTAAEPGSTRQLELTMAEGYLSEPVIVRLDGNVVLEKSISTNKATGIADYLALKPKTSQPTLQVEFPRLNLKSQATIDLNKAAYVEISLNTGRIIWRPTNALTRKD